MTNAEKRYEKRATADFKRKYGAKKRLTKKKKLAIKRGWTEEELRQFKAGTSVAKNSDGGYDYLCVTRKCNRRGKTARFLSTDRRYLCQKCYNRYRRQEIRKLGCRTKDVRKARRNCTPEQREKERRKRIFAKWKDKELDKLRRTPEYEAWRIAVLERDEYKCQHCEKTGGRLHAHHIKRFKPHPELRYDVDNGITLCRQCHEDLHIAKVDGKPFIVKLLGKTA